MPLVEVYRGRGKKWVPEELFVVLIKNLPSIISSALTCENPDGKLTPADIEVRVLEPSKYDIGGDDELQIVVFAGLYPERLINKDARQKIIDESIKEVLRGTNVHGWAWVRLAEGSFGRF